LGLAPLWDRKLIRWAQLHQIQHFTEQQQIGLLTISKVELTQH
jgi:hypothetical protein